MQIPGQRIRDFREALGWSTRDLASACNFREIYLIDIEEGNVLKVGVWTYQKIADALGITLGMLNGDDEVPENASLEEELPEGYRTLIKGTLMLTIALGILALIVALYFVFGLLVLWVMRQF